MKMMNAVVINRFGAESELTVRSIPIPDIAGNEVLIRVEYAGVGSWDVLEREGGYAEMFDSSPNFPYVLGSEGVGTVVAAGDAATRFRPGDRVMASGFLNPRGGFYAEYVAVGEDTVAALPTGYSAVESGVVLGVGITALRGVIDTLRLGPDESLCVFGASGGIGHIAVQIARALGARVTAVASRPDGAALVRRLGADSVCDGRSDTIHTTLQETAGDGFDKVFLTGGGPAADEVCRLIRPGGMIAFPAGIHPEPTTPDDTRCLPYYGEPTEEITTRLRRMIEDHDIKPHVDAVFKASDVAAAHRRVVGHHVGKVALDLRSLRSG